jgi:hypothetical protein
MSILFDFINYIVRITKFTIYDKIWYTNSYIEAREKYATEKLDV